jgi:hypothetical protein
MKKVVLYALIALACLAIAPSASAGGSITANQASPGVYFTVTGKATGGRDYFAIAVNCDSGYATRIFVTVQDGVGTSQTIYPPSGTCTADLQAAQSINKFRTLETITFSV